MYCIVDSCSFSLWVSLRLFGQYRHEVTRKKRSKLCPGKRVYKSQRCEMPWDSFDHNSMERILQAKHFHFQIKKIRVIWMIEWRKLSFSNIEINNTLPILIHSVSKARLNFKSQIKGCHKSETWSHQHIAEKHSWNPSFINGGEFEFPKFSKKGERFRLSHKKGGVGKWVFFSKNEGTWYQ